MQSKPQIDREINSLIGTYIYIEAGEWKNWLLLKMCSRDKAFLVWKGERWLNPHSWYIPTHINKGKNS